MTKYDKIIQLKTKKIYFDAYGNKKYVINNGKFWDNLRYSINSKSITTFVIKQNDNSISEGDCLVITCGQVCNKRKFIIKEYILTLNQFIEKLLSAIDENESKIILDIEYEISNDKFFCRNVCNTSNFLCNFAKSQVVSSNKLSLIFEFEKEEVIEALEYYNTKTYEVAASAISAAKETKNSYTMSETQNTSAQSIFSFSNMNCGVLDDENVISTAFGIAIKRNGSLYVFDKKKKRMASMPKIALTYFPVYIIPTSTLEFGDLIKLDGKYYYFLKQNEGKITVLDPLTDVETNIYPALNILDFTVFSKIITILDLK